MKHLITILLLLSYWSLHAQNVEIKLFVQDNIGRMDTVTFGMKTGSTVGIDTTFSEEDIYGSPWDSLDIRVIQRDSANHNCITTTPWSTTEPNFYFPNNIDSKVDYRPPTFSFNDMSANFEIYVHAVEYPVTVCADFTDIATHILEGWSTVHPLDSTCNWLNYYSMYANTTFDSLFVLQDSTENTIIAHFEHEVGIDEVTTSFATIYPNPTDGPITITLEEALPATVTIYNRVGQMVHSQFYPAATRHELDLTAPAGLYLLRIATGGQVISRKVFKK